MHISHHHSVRARSTAFAHAARRLVCWLPALAFAVSGVTHAQSWPTKPVRIVVPVSPGGTTDLLARMVGEALAKNLGQSFVVDAKPGAAGAIGSMEVARAANDGYTLLMGTSSTHAVNPAISTQLKYNAVDDFTPIALVAESNNVLLVAPKLEAKDLKEMLALARAKPGYLNYSSSGIGSFGHLTFEYLGSQAGIVLTHVPYKGTSASITDISTGAVHMAADALPSAMPYVKDGRLRALAVTGSRRSPLAPEIPTVAEAGLPGFSVVSWFGLYGPRGMNPQLAQRINAEVAKVLAAPDTVARFAALGIEPAKGSPADFAAMVATDTVRWSRLAKDIKLKID